MKKKSDEEIGLFITREIKAMMLNDSLSYEQRTKLFCAIVGDEPLEDGVMAAFAESLKTGYKVMNERNKEKIEARRERQKEYQRNLRTSTEMSVDKRTSTRKKVDVRTSRPKEIDREIDNIPLNPPKGVDGEMPPEISVEELMGDRGVGRTGARPPHPAGGDVRDAAGEIADRLEETEAWGHMMVNRGKLMKCLVSVLKKNGGAGGADELAEKMLAGLKAWTATWAAAEWRYAPGKITDWLYDGKWQEEPRKPKAAEPSVGAGCGECGVEIV